MTSSLTSLLLPSPAAVTRGQSGALNEVLLVLVPPWLCDGSAGGRTQRAVPLLSDIYLYSLFRELLGRGRQGLRLSLHFLLS